MPDYFLGTKTSDVSHFVIVKMTVDNLKGMEHFNTLNNLNNCSTITRESIGHPD